ncbi:MAG: hypothetical protein WCG80_17100 [Spirochaetales bacterium]
MKTWRQGVLGKVSVAGRAPFYLRCLTYPLAQTYRALDAASGRLSEPLGFVRVRLDDFAAIERVGDTKLTAAERRLDPEAPWSAW